MGIRSVDKGKLDWDTRLTTTVVYRWRLLPEGEYAAEDNLTCSIGHVEWLRPQAPLFATAGIAEVEAFSQDDGTVATVSLDLAPR
ncbi:unnamed protein product [Hydatigera taeniaeformis]|uniref:ATP-dependent DNA ligase n=1 Tax=Hydatigena taeniaeformis TaxID=6205 RepID=A0A0R3WQN7_HYDTA|nr:unnamed protein product [Hydatigera taeniaeformis]